MAAGHVIDDRVRGPTETAQSRHNGVHELAQRRRQMTTVIALEDPPLALFGVELGDWSGRRG